MPVESKDGKVKAGTALRTLAALCVSIAGLKSAECLIEPTPIAFLLKSMETAGKKLPEATPLAPQGASLSAAAAERA